MAILNQMLYITPQAASFNSMILISPFGPNNFMYSKLAKIQTNYSQPVHKGTVETVMENSTIIYLSFGVFGTDSVKYKYTTVYLHLCTHIAHISNYDQFFFFFLGGGI